MMPDDHSASVPDLLRAEVLSRDPDGIARAPASIARKAEDKKSVVLSMSVPTKPQRI